jgi:signal transduction histidine kinase
MPGKRIRSRNSLIAAAGAGAALAVAVGLLSLAAPRLISRHYDQKSLAWLEKQSREVRREFTSILKKLEAREERWAKIPTPSTPEDWFSLFKGSGLDTETQGIALTTEDGNPIVWYGNVLSLIDLVPSASFEALKAQPAAFLMQSKSSVYLVRLARAGDGGNLLAHFVLLAFIPQFQSSFILEYHALHPSLKAAFDIDYWDFQEDVSGFEKFFARHDDVFAGQPRQENEIQTLYFPLRNQANRILATVTLSSPSLTSKLTEVRQNFRLILLLLLAASYVLALLFFWTSPGFLKGGRGVPAALIIVLSVGLRAIAFPLAQLERFRALEIFSPALAGFHSLASLTRSPADLFLTGLLVFGLCACLAVYARPLISRDAPEKPARPAAVLVPVLAGFLSGAGLLLFTRVLKELVFNSNLSLLRWSLKASFLILHLSLLLLLAALILLVFVAFRLAAAAAGRGLPTIIAIAASAGAVLIVGGGVSHPVLLLLHGVFLAWIFVVAAAPGLGKKREVAFLGLLAAALWTSWSLESLTSLRTRVLIETTLRHTIISQESWGEVLMEQSFPELDRSQRSIVSFFKNPVDKDYAHSLWERSLVAKFNWYSCLELRDAEGNLLSRFSLNFPKFYGRPPDLEPSDIWTVVSRSMNFIGKEKEFLVGYRDWRDESHYYGRLILYVSLDPEMLPFLYSANPYFEVLRTDSMPSLNQFDFGCAVYDPEGNPLFNPRKLTVGIGPEEMDRLARSGTPFWSRFTERGTVYDTYLFRDRGHIYSLFTPVKNFKSRAVDFLRLFFLDLAVVAAILLLFTLLSGRARFARPLWSFSNRVYAAFLAAALIPLLMYTVFTRNLFDRIIMERFVEDAAIHASYAQGLMEAFLVIGNTPISPYLAPSEDLALWISSTLSNDVNLYSDAIIVASSRRELFDSGLLPDLLDGEAYESLVYAKKPFFTERTTIGGYSFETLTVPYFSKSSTLFISLPFPFEQQEIARATREIVEFLVLLIAFFSVVVIVLSRGIRAMIIVPVRKLLAGTREVGLGNLEVQIDHRSRDEMMTLIDGFNTMVKNLKAHEQELAEMSKKVAWTEMARKVAHEIKNPLTPIQLSAEHVLKVHEEKKGDFDRALQESMSYIIGEVENLRRIAQDFMEIARDTTPRRDPLDLAEVLEDTLQPYRKLLAERIRFKVVTAGRDFRTRGDAAKLKTALRNLIANAVESIGRKGEVGLSLSREGTLFRIVIRDTGSGMSPETIARIFDPYFSTKDSGTGLGLPIAKRIVEEHGGTIRVASQIGAGTTVTVELPIEE